MTLCCKLLKFKDFLVITKPYTNKNRYTFFYRNCQIVSRLENYADTDLTIYSSVCFCTLPMQP